MMKLLVAAVVLLFFSIVVELLLAFLLAFLLAVEEVFLRLRLASVEVLDRPFPEHTVALQPRLDDLDARREVTRAGHRLHWVTSDLLPDRLGFESGMVLKSSTLFELKGLVTGEYFCAGLKVCAPKGLSEARSWLVSGVSALKELNPLTSDCSPEAYSNFGPVFVRRDVLLERALEYVDQRPLLAEERRHVGSFLVVVAQDELLQPGHEALVIKLLEVEFALLLSTPVDHQVLYCDVEPLVPAVT